jgi:hypothetical protein
MLSQKIVWPASPGSPSLPSVKWRARYDSNVIITRHQKIGHAIIQRCAPHFLGSKLNYYFSI